MHLNRRAFNVVQWLFVSAAALAAGGIALGLLWLSRPLVTITTVVEGPVVESFYATGAVQPIREYPIKTGNAGILTKVLVDKGWHVSEGQELAVVEDPQLRYALDKAAAELDQARLRADEKASPVLQEFDAKLQANAAMLDRAQIEEKRFTEMAAKGGASRTDLDKAADHVKDMWSMGESLKSQRQAALIQLKTDLRVAEAKLAAARGDFDHQTLRSPIDGVVLDRPTPLGTRLNVNVNDHVMQIADVRPENLVMRAAVDEENVVQLRDGQLVRMSLYSFPGRSFEGRVTKIYDKADAERRTFEVDVKITPTEPRLAAGMTGELAFILSEKDRALIAPSQALQNGLVYGVRDGRLVRVADAKIGARSVERIELAAGFQLGDTIVISPAKGLTEGQHMRTNMIQPLGAAEMNRPNSDAVHKNPLGDQ